MSLLVVLSILLLAVLVIMAFRDGRPFFADYLKVAALLLSVTLAVLTWLPFPHK